MKDHSILLELTGLNRKIIGGFILLIIFIALAVFIFPAQFQNLNAVRRQLAFQVNLIKAREIKAARLLSIKEEYNKLADGLKKAHNMFFNNEEVSVFLKGINGLVEHKTNNNLLVVNFLSEKPIESENPDDSKGFIYTKKVINLVIEGSFNSIENLMKRFDNYGKLLKIRNIKLENAGEKSKIRAEFELIIYLLTEGDLE